MSNFLDKIKQSIKVFINNGCFLYSLQKRTNNEKQHNEYDSSDLW